LGESDGVDVRIDSSTRDRNVQSESSATAPPLGKILDAAGLPVYEGDREALAGGGELHDSNLERLKKAIQSRYEARAR